jgi:regulator of CtrA degradation
MNEPATINARIIESLYCEALVLSDEVRNAFDLSRPIGRSDGHGALADEAARAELSSEALRTTTRMMHALAWLLNQRAYLAGELSELQLHRYGQLTPERPADKMHRPGLISPENRRLIQATEHFYARLLRLDREWRERDPHTTVDALRKRIGSALAG